MPFAVARFRDSAIASTRSPEEVLAAIMLWSASWHQVPAASLPATDAELAQLAGYGRGVRDFTRVKRGATHGLVLCADGRYWHAVVAAKAAFAWNRKLEERHRKACDRRRKFNAERRARGEVDLPLPSAPHRLVQDADQPRWHYVDSNGNQVCSNRKAPPIPPETDADSAGIPASKGKGTIKGVEEVQNRQAPFGAADRRDQPINGNGHHAIKATRLPADWRLPDEWRQWAQDAHGVESQRAVRMSLAFRDYWVAKPGRGGVKLDWQATWRNWVRREVGDA